MDTIAIIAACPEFKDVESDMNIINTMVDYAKAKTPVSTALQEVRIMSKQTPEMIIASCKAVLTTNGDVYAPLMEKFNQEAEADVDAISIEPYKERFDSEIAEQTGLRNVASRVMEMASTLALALNIPIPATPNTGSGLTPPKKSFWVRVGVLEDVEKTTPVVNQLLSWLTEPVLEEKDDLVQTTVLLDQKYEAQAKSAEAVREFAKKFNMDDSALVELILDVVAEARKQVAQSDAIIANVTKDYAYYEKIISLLLSVKQDTDLVRTYLNGK